MSHNQAPRNGIAAEREVSAVGFATEGHRATATDPCEPGTAHHGDQLLFQAVERLACAVHRKVIADARPGADSDLEAFNHNRAEGSFAPLAVRPRT